jgi:hypothetical protein
MAETETNDTEESLRDELIATNTALDAMGELYKRVCAKRDEERARADKAEARVKFLSDLRNNIAIERDRAETKVDSLTSRVADLEDEVRRLQRALAPHEGRHFYECDRDCGDCAAKNSGIGR